MRKQFFVIVPGDIKPRPSEQELTAAYILAEYFQANVEFVARGAQKSADYLISGKYWELKSPTGVGKHNVQHTLQRASRQSKNIIFDARLSKMHASRLKYELRSQMRLIHSISRLLLIEKGGKVVEIVR